MLLRDQRAFHVMAKPIGPLCNLNCRYCFYLEKAKLYPAASMWRMPDEVLESYIRQYIQSQDAPVVTFAWQGGEPTLLDLAFFRRAVELQKQYADGRCFENTLQTNGINLDDPWCQFLRKTIFSLDCPSTAQESCMTDIESTKGAAPPSTV